MVAISIIGILSAVLIPNFLSARAKSRDAKRISDIKQIQAALEVYFDQCDVYPTPVSSIYNDYGYMAPQVTFSVINNTMLTNHDSSCPAGVTLGTYIADIPTPPTGSNLVVPYYRYAVNSTNKLSADIKTEYHLGSVLEKDNSALQDAAHFNSYNGTDIFYLGFKGDDPSFSGRMYDIHSK